MGFLNELTEMMMQQATGRCMAWPAASGLQVAQFVSARNKCNATNATLHAMYVYLKRNRLFIGNAHHSGTAQPHASSR
jgi:hypothetical protein